MSSESSRSYAARWASTIRSGENRSAASPFVRDRIAEHAAARVVAGATEATALGNALLQGIALERFRNLDDARGWASASSVAP